MTAPDVKIGDKFVRLINPRKGVVFEVIDVRVERVALRSGDYVCYPKVKYLLSGRYERVSRKDPT